MAQTIKLKRSSVSGNTPSTSDLELGEVAINTYDGKMFIKKNDGSDSIVEIGGGSGTVTEAFKTIAVSGQSNVVADSATDTLTLVAGSNMTITTNASGDTITFASSGGGGSQNLFSTFAVSGQNNVVADSTTDTFTFVAGTGITLTTDASADSITITNSATGANAFGNVVVSGQSTVAADGTNDNLTLVAGTGITLTTDASADSVTITNSAAAGNSFGTFAVSGQGSVVADQANDTLTLVAGSNVTLTTSAAGDSITIASSGGGGGGSVDAGASITEFKYDVSGSTTSFSGSDANSNTLAYTAGALQVYLNGILLDPATDYTATNGTSIVLTDAAVSGDDLQIIAFNRKILNANTTVNTFSGDGSTTAFTLSTDPVNENNTNIFIDGVYQSKSNYSVSGTTLTFSTAPPNGSGIEVSLGFQQASISSTLDFDDNAILRLGTGNDLQLLHDGSNSIIKDTGTGDLILAGSRIQFTNAAVNENIINAVANGAVELYHNNAKKLETVTGGVTVTGTVTATTFSGDLSGTINTATTGTTQSASDNSTKIATTAYVDTAVTNLVDSAPGTLNTLNELAAALGDDANFSTTITNSLATKVGQTATTGAATIPAGTTAQRPGSPAAGQFRYNSTLSQFEGYTSSWGAIGGGGTNTFTTDIFTANGSTTAFTLTQAVSSPNDCIVHIDGIYQTPTDAYTVSGTTLTFSSAPANTRKIVVYSVRAGVSGNNLNIETFSGDGSATSFTMSINPINENNTIVHIDGVYQQKTSYSTSGTTLSFSAAPANGTTIEVATFTQTEINVPVNDTIDTVHIKDDAVTSAKLGGNLTTPGHLTITGALITNEDTSGLLTLGRFSGATPYSLIRPSTNATGLEVRTHAGNALARFLNNGTTELYYSAAKKLETVTGGVTVTGTLTATTLAGTLSTAAQSNITSVGTLSSLTISGDLTADTSTLKVDSTNNRVGVGTATPGQTFHVVGGSATAALLVNNGSNGDIVRIGKAATDVLKLRAEGTADGVIDASGGSMILKTGGSLAMRIDSSGNVGIGTSPSSELHVKGTNETQVWIDSATNTNPGIRLLENGTNKWTIGNDNTNDSLFFYDFGASDTRLSITSDGNVGIGTTSPDYKLDIEGAISDQAPLLRGTVTGTPPNAFNWVTEFMSANLLQDRRIVHAIGKARSTNNAATISYVQRSNTNHNAIAFGHFGNNDLVNFTYEGNVGIGTTSPTGKLDVQIASAGIAQYVYNTGSNQAYINFANATTGKYTQAFGTPGGLLVGVDTDETSIVWNGSNTALRFGTNSTERMRIDANGHIGINATPPTHNLGKLLTLNGTNAVGTGTSGGYFGYNMYYNSAWKYQAAAASALLSFETGGDFTIRQAAPGSVNASISYAETFRMAPGGNANFSGYAYNSSSGIMLYAPQGRIYTDIDFNTFGAEILLVNNRTAGGQCALLQYRTAGAIEGTIVGNSTGLTISNVSDYRKKQNIRNLTGSLNIIKSLQPRIYEYQPGFGKPEGDHVGFIAHEIQEHIPSMVDVEKDAVYTQEDIDGGATEVTVGQPKYQTVAYSNNEMITRLVQAMQEQQAMIETLQAEVTALKGA